MWVSIYLYICIIHIRTCADKYMLDSVEERRKQVIISNVLILLIFSCNHQQFSCKEIRTSPKFSKNNWTSSLSRFDFHTNSFDAYPTINSWVPQKRSIFFPIDSPKFTPEERILREKNAVLLEPLSYAVVKDHLTGAVGTWDFFRRENMETLAIKTGGFHKDWNSWMEKWYVFWAIKNWMFFVRDFGLHQQKMETRLQIMVIWHKKQQELCRFFSWDFANNSAGKAAMEILGI